MSASPISYQDFFNASVMDQVSLEINQAVDLQKDHPYFTDKQVEALYSIAYSFRQGGAYERALNSFLLVLRLRPKNLRYIEATARSYADLEKYLEASNMYAYAILCGGDGAKNMLAMAYCYIYSGLVVEAGALLSLLIKMFEKDEKSEDSIEVANHLLHFVYKEVHSAISA